MLKRTFVTVVFFMFASTQSSAQSSRYNENESSWIHWIVELFQSNESTPFSKAGSIWSLPTSTRGGLALPPNSNGVKLESEVSIDPFKKHWEIIAFQNDI